MVLKCKLGSVLGLGRFPWRREWQSTPLFLPGESHGGAWQAIWSMGLQRVGHN